MLGHKDAHKLFRLADELGLRLTFVGDPRQHGSVPRGAFLHVLKTYGHITPLKVTKIIRQEDPEHRAAVQLFADGKTAEGVDAMDRLGLVREMDIGDIARHAAEDYMQAMADGASCVVVSPTHAEANAVTDAIRAELRAAGKLGNTEKEFSRLVQINASEAERKHAFTYRPGDVLVFQQNAKGGFTKGDRLTVTDPALVPIEHADKFSLYRSESIGLAVGDKIRFIGRVEAKGGGKTYRNGSTGTVAGFTDAGNIRLEDGHVIDADAGLFRHGYVSTTFGAQGCTAKRAILAMSSRSLAAINMEALYVAATRAKEWVRLYTDDKDAVRRQAGVSSRKMAALDLRPKKLEPAHDWPERLKDITDHRRRLDYCELVQAGSESRPGWSQRLRFRRARTANVNGRVSRRGATAMSDEKESNVLGLSRTRPKLGPKPSVISQLLDRTYDGPGRTEPERGRNRQPHPGQARMRPPKRERCRASSSSRRCRSPAIPTRAYSRACARHAADALPAAWRWHPAEFSL